MERSRRHRRRGSLAALVTTAVAALVGAGLTAPLAAAADSPLMINAGFESGLSGWTCDAGTGSVVSSPVHSGAGALKATPAGQSNARCTQVVSVQPNSSYTLTGWVRGAYVYLGASGTGTTDTSTWVPSATDWHQLTTGFTTGADTTSVTLYVHGWYGQGTYYADDLALDGPPGDGGGDPGDPQAPAAPTGLTVGTVTANSVDLSWTAVQDAASYRIYADGQPVMTASGASATVTSLQPDTAYTFAVSAVNGAGESAKSTTVQARTASGGGGDGGGQTAVPAHAVTGYVQDFDNGAPTQRLTDVPDAYDIIAVAFADATSTPGKIGFHVDPALAPSAADFTADVAAKHAEGKAVVLSVGGAEGTVSITDDASATAFADSAYALMQQYGFDGIDIDLEHGLNSVYLTKALRQLSAKAGPGLVLTMAPQTLDMQSTSTEYFKTALNVKDILTVVNMQYYNSGSMLGCDNKVYSQGTVDFLTALACIQLEGGLDPSQVGLGLPASSRAAGSGYVSPSVVNDALDCLARGTHCGSFTPPRTYPSLRGAMTWSTNWDALNGNAWSGAVGPHVHALP